jgi:hypothetical protein
MMLATSPLVARMRAASQSREARPEPEQETIRPCPPPAWHRQMVLVSWDALLGLSRADLVPVRRLAS